MSILIVQLLLATLLCACTVMDVRSYRIPNWLTIPGMVSGVVVHSILNGFAGILFSSKGLLLGLGLFLLLYMLGGMGAGDVKLMAAVGSLLGPDGALWASIVTFIAGGLYSIVVMIDHWGMFQVGWRMVTMMRTLVLTRNVQGMTKKHAQHRLPYAPVIGLGTMISCLFKPPF